MRTAAAAAATGLALLLLAGPAAAEEIGPRQRLVGLTTTHAVRAAPSVDERKLAYVGARRPLTAARTVLPVLAQHTDAAGRGWLRVRLPGRVLRREAPPRSGWIRSERTFRWTTPWHVVVDVSARRVTVHHEGHVLRRFRAIVGAPATPTPLGRFFVEEDVRLGARQAGAPFALALSARSSVLQEFAGGPGQIALHGLVGVGGTLGSAVSHGCVRLSTTAIRWLAARISPGVPVTVVR